LIIWIDAQLSPNLAPWITEVFGVEAKSVREIGLRDADDREIYERPFLNKLKGLM